MASQVARTIALVRDASLPPARRAFAAAALAAGDIAESAAASENPATRMFGFNTRHDDAQPWDGRGMRSGTITYLETERIEQYVGQQKWIAYAPRELGDFRADVGDQVRISRRGNGVSVEPIGPNRLEADAQAAAREAASGMFVLRTSDFTADEVLSSAQSVAERYAAELRDESEAIVLAFRGGAGLLTIAPESPQRFAAFGSSALLSEPVAGALRLGVSVRSNKLDAAVDAEHALLLFAAMVTSDAEGIALDDSGAVFSSEELYLLGTKNEMRADAFTFAAAAAHRAWPPAQTWLSPHAALCDELIVFSSRPWRADFAARFLERELNGLAEAANENDDPVVPGDGRLVPAGERDAPGTLERLAVLSYRTVDIEVGFVDASCGDDMRAKIEARKDIEALLGRSVASAVVFSIVPRADEAAVEPLEREIRRAQTVATALGAAFAQRGDSVACDIFGAVFAADDLLRLALRRCGTSASWNARVASFVGLDGEKLAAGAST
jgi:hypothetical protein